MITWEWARDPWLVALGWVLLLAIPSSTMVACVLAGWHLLRRRASARDRYRLAVCALAAALLLALLVPVLLIVSPGSGDTRAVSAPRESGVGSLTAVPSRDVLPQAGHAPLAAATAWMSSRATAVPPAAIGLGASAWLVCAGGAVGRLAIAATAARRLRRRATSMDEGPLQQALERLAARIGVKVPVLAVSSEIEAPVTLGFREPVVLLPTHLLEYMRDNGLAPVLAHELAHVARRDYVVHFTQSVVEALLLHSPAIWWIGSHIREAREFCCDDVAVAVAGDRTHYVESLTLVARLGARTTARPALGIAGPRLITRVRRLIEGEPVVSTPLVRTALIACASVVGAALLPITFATASQQLSAPLQAAGAGQDGPPVPFGYPQRQEGSSLRVLRVTSTDSHVCGRFELRNEASVWVRQVRFVGLVYRPGADRAVRTLESEWFTEPIAPGATATVDARLVDVASVRREARGEFVQAFCAVRELVYENGVASRPSFASAPFAGRDAVRAQGATLPPDFVDQTHAKVGTGGTFCVDDRGAEYSSGTQISIRDQPWRAARCQSTGQWREVDPRTGEPLTSGDSPPMVVALDVDLEGVAASVRLTSAAGAVATVRTTNGRTWGLVPTVGADGRVAVALHDMSANPHRLIATRPLQPGRAVGFEDASPIVSVTLASR